MARLKPSLICVVLMVFLRSNQAQQQGPLANISVAEAATAAANARHWMQRQNAGRTLGSGCSGDKCVEACGEDWEKNGDHCYFWGTDKKNWTEAEDFCQREGGHLASVTSNATRDFVLEGMNRKGLNDAYLGGNDIEEEGTWKWADCTPWGVTFWAPSEPNDAHYQPVGNQNCLHQILKWTHSGAKGYDHKWNDMYCNRGMGLEWGLGFVCSKKICSGGSVPKHTTENAAVKTENAVTGDSMMWKPASGFLISTILLLLFLF